MANPEVSQVLRMLAGKNARQCIDSLLSHGWTEIGGGSFKRGFAKGGLVVKVQRSGDGSPFQRKGETAPEWAQAWTALPANLRRFLAKPLAIGQFFNVQERVGNIPEWCSKEHCEGRRALLERAWKAAGQSWRLSDGEHNHGHTEAGEPVWFDGL